jgi:serine/threonine protein kinase
MVGQLESGEQLVPSPPGDMWSLGCLLLHMVTGQAPWHGLPVLQICKRVRGRPGAHVLALARRLSAHV